jgi:hypothetical protein
MRIVRCGEGIGELIFHRVRDENERGSESDVPGVGESDGGFMKKQDGLNLYISLGRTSRLRDPGGGQPGKQDQA